MTGATEERHSKSLIDKAEIRVAYQRAVVRRMISDVDRRDAQALLETLARMEARLERLLTCHSRLLELRQSGVSLRCEASEAETMR